MSLKALYVFEEMHEVSSAALEAIVNSIPAGVIAVERKSRKIVYVNDRFVELTGFNPKGLSFREYAFNMSKARKLDNGPFLYEQLPLIKALLYGKTTRNQEIGIERADKAKVTILVNAKPLIDDKGEITGAIAVLEDVTESRKAEKALKRAKARLQKYTRDLQRLVEERTEKLLENEQNYRDLYESFGEALIVTDWNLNVTNWNVVAERVTTVPAKEALGKKIYEVMPEMLSVNITPHLETLQQKKPARFMINVQSRETGKPSIFEISTYPAVKGIIIIVEDKTEEDEIRRLSAIGQVAGMVGHDIRNPLQAILGDVYLLREYLTGMPEMQTKKDVAESLSGIAQNVEYVNKIVADLQDFVKPLSPSLMETSLNSILDDVLAKQTIPDNVELCLSITEQAKSLVTDPGLLKRILVNLVSNAVQAMSNGGKLVVKAIREGTNFVLTVEDNGVGIPEDLKTKIFTPLFTTKAKGQGFGLAAAKRMTEALGGTIKFESKEGKGTRFLISLPEKQH